MQLCAACPPGTFSAALGASSCQPCPAGGVCPVLTTVPFTMATMENTRNPAIVTSQPPNLPSYADNVNRAFWMLAYVLGGSWFLIVCISVCMYKSGKYRHNLRKLDIFFFTEHDECTKPVDAGVEEWRSLLITEWQTELGGIWSMFFFLIGATFISFFLIPYLLGNTLEKRSLVPLLSVDPLVVPLVNGTFVMKLALYGYAQSCVVPGTDSVCDPLIVVRGTQSWPIVSAQQLSCRFTPLTATLDSTCWVQWQCTSCQVSTGGSTIGFVLDQGFALAKSIAWSFSSTTGVANAQGDFGSNLPSTTASTIAPDASDFVFRSYAPSVVAIVATPTTFVSEVATQPINTGYHVQYMSHVKGSQVPSATLAYFRGLAFQFNITVNNNMFQIVRSNQTTILTFVSQLIGALNALLTGFAALLTIVERRVWGKDEENTRIDRQKRLNMAVSSQKQAAASVAEVGGGVGGSGSRSSSSHHPPTITASQSGQHGGATNRSNSPLAPGYSDDQPLVSPSHRSSSRSSRVPSAGTVHAVAADSSVTIEMHALPTASARQHPSLSQTVATPRNDSVRISARDQIAGTASQRKSILNPSAARLPTLTARKSGD